MTSTIAPRQSRGGTKRIERVAQLRWIPLSQIQYHELAQRDLLQAWVKHLAEAFDLEQFGSPTVNHRDGVYYMLDGMHRTEALKAWFGEGQWENQQIQCWTYTDLTDAEMAETFLRLNDTRAVSTYEKYRKAVVAGRSAESDANKILQAHGIRVARSTQPGTTAAVGAIMRVYHRDGGHALGQSVRLLFDAFGDDGLKASLIDGIGLLCHRYAGDLNIGMMASVLGSKKGGVISLLNKAEVLRRATGNSLPQCIAAAVVEINNKERATSDRPAPKKLPDWWRVA